MALPGVWEQQPGESARAYRAFCCFRDLAPQVRTLEHALQAYREDDAPRPNIPGYFKGWSASWSWVERAASWDAFRDREQRAAQLEAEKDAVRDMVKRHTRDAMQLQAKAMKALLKTTLKTLRDKPHAAIRMFVEATKLERLTRGQPSEILGTDDEAKALEVEEGVERVLQQILADPSLAEHAEALAIAIERSHQEALEGGAGGNAGAAAPRPG